MSLTRYPNEILIDDSNAHEYIGPVVVDGQVKAKGLVPRDYNLYPVGYLGCAPGWEVAWQGTAIVVKEAKATIRALDMPLIPKEQWAERITEMERTNSRLSDMRSVGNSGQLIPSLDQGSRGYSHTADTECLTLKGWVKWPDYNGTDLLATVNPHTHIMEFQAPTERHAYEYNDEMYYSSNRRLDFGVTRNHRMLVRKWDESKRTLSQRYTEQRADSLGWYVGMMPAPIGHLGINLEQLSIDGDRAYSGDDFLALISLICSDGYAAGRDGVVSFCCFREDRYPKVAALARRVGFTEQESRRGVFNKRGAWALHQWLQANCYTGPILRSPYKRVPDIVKTVRIKQIKHFLDYFGDKNHGADAQQRYYSSSKQMIDDLQELHLRIGKRGTISEREPRSTVYEATGQTISGKKSYVLAIAERDTLCIDRKKHIETDRYRGLVYCATVPNGTLITRRNGSVLISGNCWGHSGVSACTLIRCRDNQPYVGLSAYAICCIIKNYRDEGGWGAAGLEFLTNRGVPSEKYWPMQSTSKANDKPETWANAALHKVSEGWVDLTPPVYSRNMTWDQTITCLLCRIPVILDYNWWGHSVCGADPVNGTSLIPRNAAGKRITYGEDWDITGGICVRIWNSWGDSWSDKGMGLLSPTKSIPDGASAPRALYGAAT